MSRGNRRLAIFKETSDYHEFLKCLAMTKETCAFTIHALCLMTNHFHMCIETEDVEIWKIMHRLLLTYAANYNIKYKLTGHLFENRYIGQLIEDDRYFLEVSRYIHLNPVKAGMVKSMALEGIEGFPVEIEAATIRGQQQMVSIIGLGDQAVKEAGERIQAAITCYGYDLPKDKTLISLAPGNRRKRGSHYDLGMTLALLAETDQIRR